MNSKYIAIALAIAGIAATSNPANAGAVNVKGGTTSSSKVIDYTETKYNYITNVINNVVNTSSTKHVDGGTKVTGTKVVKGNTTVKNKTGKVTTNYNYANHKGKTTNVGSKDYSSVSAAKKDIGNLAIEATKVGRSGYNLTNASYDSKTGNVYADSTAGHAKFGYGTDVDISSTTKKGKVKKDGKAYLTGYEKAGTSVSKDVSTSSHTESSSSSSMSGGSVSDKLTSVKYEMSNDAIFVGDTDNYAGGYAAQGNVNVANHYYRTITYTIVNTVVNTTYNDTQTTYTTTQNLTAVKTQDYKQTNTTNYTIDVTSEVTPIVLDLDGDGKIEASNGQYLAHKGDFSKNTVLFDFYGDGFPIMCEWVGANDGLLCRPEADGTVKGVNLFGSANGYENGYDELASLDTDCDGKLEGSELEGLMVWSDANRNGIADKGELQSLEELGITSIDTNHENLSSSFTRNGKTFKSFDWSPSVLKGRKVSVSH